MSRPSWGATCGRLPQNSGRLAKPSDLPQRLIGGDPGRRAQVERPEVGIGVRDRHASVGKLLVKPLGSPNTRVPEDKAVPVLETDLPEPDFGPGREEPKAPRRGGA